MVKIQHLGKFGIFLSMIIKLYSYSYNIPYSNGLLKN